MKFALFLFGLACNLIGHGQRRLFYYYIGIERFNGADMEFPRWGLFWIILGIAIGIYPVWKYAHLLF
jgi:hypothetical protein